MPSSLDAYATLWVTLPVALIVFAPAVWLWVLDYRAKRDAGRIRVAPRELLVEEQKGRPDLVDHGPPSELPITELRLEWSIEVVTSRMISVYWTSAEPRTLANLWIAIRDMRIWRDKLNGYAQTRDISWTDLGQISILRPGQRYGMGGVVIVDQHVHAFHLHGKPAINFNEEGLWRADLEISEEPFHVSRCTFCFLYNRKTGFRLVECPLGKLLGEPLSSGAMGAPRSLTEGSTATELERKRLRWRRSLMEMQGGVDAIRNLWKPIAGGEAFTSDKGSNDYEWEETEKDWAELKTRLDLLARGFSLESRILDIEIMNKPVRELEREALMSDLILIEAVIDDVKSHLGLE